MGVCAIPLVLVIALGYFMSQSVKKLKEKHRRVMAQYSNEYEQRKQTIGTIKCSQCEWSGQWGTGMIFQQFFAGELAKAGIDVKEHVVDNDNLSSHTQQYTCPVCNSPGWEKV